MEREMTPVAKGALFVFTAGCLSYIFLKVPAAQGFANPDLARLVTMHLPCAYVALVAAVIAAWHGIAYLRKRDLSSDIKSYVGAKIAFLYCFLTTITGSMFARVQWGSYWNWDPRQTAVAVLLLVYAAYFTLRASIEDPERRAALSAVYVLFASILTPMLGYVIPTFFIDQSLHPKFAKFDLSYRMAIYPMAIALTWHLVWMFRLSVRAEKVNQAIAELELTSEGGLA
jgi:heme exporter protein C